MLEMIMDMFPGRVLADNMTAKEGSSYRSTRWSKIFNSVSSRSISSAREERLKEDQNARVTVYFEQHP